MSEITHDLGAFTVPVERTGLIVSWARCGNCSDSKRDKVRVDVELSLVHLHNISESTGE